ncbi:hypothetical protein T11_11484 [Trichinella zimbabwensis]|uniref:Uncharacterized protein n=1 Tax=Trichinella zimbabwensis TaxID=268475 RepID=A0A0V1HSK4_9BILA|nr:hypothetical protein T11_1502 [Trichinella zimbabwensis]KRZ13747.1 hypothetical protein T11_11484 [Trichinella zimbabwensis]
MVLPIKEPHPNRESNNGNVTYMTPADLQQAYDNVLETAVSECLRRKEILSRNPRESGSGSTEMLAPSLQQQQHDQQQQQQGPIIHIPLPYCVMYSPFQSESSMQYQHLQLPEIYESNRGNSELLPQSTCSNGGWQSHEYVLPPIEWFLPPAKIELGFLSSSSTCEQNGTSEIVPTGQETHFAPIVSSSSEDMQSADEFTSENGSLSSTAAEVQQFLLRDDLSSEDSETTSVSFQASCEITKVDKACQTDDWLYFPLVSSERSSPYISSEEMLLPELFGGDESPMPVSAFELYRRQRERDGYSRAPA